MPGSDTDTRTCPCIRCAETRTVPPEGEYLIALDRRLETTCAIRSRSATTSSGPSGRSSAIVCRALTREDLDALPQEPLELERLRAQR